MSFSPDSGWVSTKQYVGTDAEIRALAAQIKKEKTDDEAGTPPTVSLQIAPAGGGLSTLDISYDDDIGSGVESTTWSLQASDYEKNIWTHPTVRALAISCPDEHKALKEAVKKAADSGKWDDILEAMDCFQLATAVYTVNYNLFNNFQGVAAPTDSTNGAAAMEAMTGRTFTEGSAWTDITAVSASLGGSHILRNGTWTPAATPCCMASKVIMTYFRDGVDSFIVSRYVLRKSLTMPTSTKDIYGLQNVNKRVTPWQMENKEGVPTGLKFAMPDDGEWLKKAPNVQYQRTKMVIDQEYWHADDWNDYIYEQASY